MITGPNVFSIPPGAPFLSTLVEALLSGKLVQGFAPSDDPLALASATIWVPTRRAARSLASEFAGRLKGGAALLPSIHALGDLEENGQEFFEHTPGDLEAIMPAMDSHLVLTRLVMGWANALNPRQREIYSGQDIVVPSSMADAIRFAAELKRLMDTVATEEVSWETLDSLVPDDHAHWWQLTLEFLQIARVGWPAILNERGFIDGATARVERLRTRAAAHESGDGDGPVIAAGSTGSIPATAHLLKTIAHLPNGAVVLPGLDRDLDEETWAKVDLPDNERDDSGTAPGHPQFGLKRLLDNIGAGRADVHHIGGLEGQSTGRKRVREELISAALRPSFSTGHWQKVIEDFSPEQRVDAFAGIALVEAPGEREEGLAIAFALREALEDRKSSAALVTPNRNLARRVAVELRRFGIDVDDSAGHPLNNRPAGIFARLVVSVAFGVPDTIAFVSLIKHPLALFGEKPATARHAAEVLELTAFRGAQKPVMPGALANRVHSARILKEDPQQRTHRSIRRLKDTDWDAALDLAQKLDALFATERDTQTALSFDELAATSTRLLEACCMDDEGELGALYDGEDGQVLASLLFSLLNQREDIECLPAHWPSAFEALLATAVVRLQGRAHPRVTILGPLEARLQTWDHIVLGGLNEGSWPDTTRNDPFLSRPMKSALGLPMPERRTGLAAHDFQMLAGQDNVLFTRSLKADNAPTVASRWLQRVVTIAGDKACAQMSGRGKRLLDWAAAIDRPALAPKPCGQPRPRPPVADRPTELAITDIETWIRDPYAVFARRILKLEALDPLVRDPDAREKGTLFHAIMEDFVNDQGARDVPGLLAIARRRFDEAAIPSHIEALWWPRFREMAPHIVAWQDEEQGRISVSHIELEGRTDSGLDGFVLKGRADRIDLLNDGTLSIIDYKTGSNPPSAAVKRLDAPQLPLEAEMARRGAFGESVSGTASQLAYVRLRPGSEFSVDRIGHPQRSAKDEDAETLGVDSWARLLDLVRAYRDPQKPYLSKARFISDGDWQSDYDHLARVREWSVADSGGDE